MRQERLRPGWYFGAPGLIRSTFKTWGARNAARRARYEVMRRSGLAHRREQRLLPRNYDGVGIATPGLLRVAGRSGPVSPGVRLYGHLEVPIPRGSAWHQHPVTGHAYRPDDHWSRISDSDSHSGDIKDTWELGRLSWLLGVAVREHLGSRRAVDVALDWIASNPPYRGPHWMCGQETALRGIALVSLYDLAADHLTDDESLQFRRAITRSIDRVRLTLSYALSQRNNHAISEAGFLWGVSQLLHDYPGQHRLQKQAERALLEAVADQFYDDGSYAQFSPTYQRLAMHVLLWCMRVSQACGAPLPEAIPHALSGGYRFLSALIVPGSGGRMPNMGGNDGALLFPLSDTDIGDFRPLLTHVSAALGRARPFSAGPWDAEADAFGYDMPQPSVGMSSPGTISAELVSSRRACAGPPMENRVPSASATADRPSVHPLTRGLNHAVLRAGPLRHRPAHADQLHVDVWMGGVPVAVDPGSYRYTAPHPWSNALADERAHNVPTGSAGPGQAIRRGRFFWTAWREADVELYEDGHLVGRVARLRLLNGTTLVRFVGVTPDVVVVYDVGSGPFEVRWNLVGQPELRDVESGRPRLRCSGWDLALCGESFDVMTRTSDDPLSGWHAPTYGVLEPLTAIRVREGPGRPVISVFSTGELSAEVRDRLDDLGSVDDISSRLELVRQLLK